MIWDEKMLKRDDFVQGENIYYSSIFSHSSYWYITKKLIPKSYIVFEEQNFDSKGLILNRQTDEKIAIRTGDISMKIKNS